MAIYSIWESRFPAAAAAEGRAVTEAIWRDMPQFEGYVSHELLVDADDPAGPVFSDLFAGPDPWCPFFF